MTRAPRYCKCRKSSAFHRGVSSTRFAFSRGPAQLFSGNVVDMHGLGSRARRWKSTLLLTCSSSFTVLKMYCRRWKILYCKCCTTKSQPDGANLPHELEKVDMKPASRSSARDIDNRRSKSGISWSVDSTPGYTVTSRKPQYL